MKRPNILIVMTDQHRHDCLGVTGNPDVRTPAIDRLAGDGVVYEQAFCAAPLCTPSRYSFITGLYPHQHMGRGNRSTIPSGLSTFPKALQALGYHTRAVGKMHYTPTRLDVGFDSLTLSEQAGEGRYDDDYHKRLRELDLVDWIDLFGEDRRYEKHVPQSFFDSYTAVESNLDEEHYSTTWIGNEGLKALEEWNTDESNLLMVSFIKPHPPYDPPAPWSRMYDPAALTLLPGWTESPIPLDQKRPHRLLAGKSITESDIRQLMAMYYGSISQIDFYVDQMIQLLKKRGLYEDTLVLFTSDHGDYMGYHHMTFKNNHMYDPLVKVPLIIKYPGNAGKGQRSGELASLIDIAPTLIRQAGDIPPEEMTGADLYSAVPARMAVLCEQGKNVYMLRTKNRKLMYAKNDKERLLFDLEKDPYELTNVYDDPAYFEDRSTLLQQLHRMILFELPTPTHVHENAPDVPNRLGERSDPKQHQAAAAWFHSRMKELLNIK